MINLKTQINSGTGTISGTDLVGLYAENFTGLTLTNHYGAYFEKQTGGTNNFGIALAGDGAGSDIVFGDSQQVKLFRDSNSGSLKSNTSIQITDSGTKPACNVDHRGEFWTEFGGSGVKDTVEVCSKAANDVYAWRTLY